MTFVTIGDLLSFSSNDGVILEEAAADAAPDVLHNAVRLAFSHLHDPLLVEACCGGSGPLAKYGKLTYEEYLALTAAIEREQAQRAATAAAKRDNTRRRRADYSARRSQLVLAMIDSGVPYVCAFPGCDVRVKLTVDHVHPISKGGTDELTNLQFLCLHHNSKKGDRSRDVGPADEVL